MSSRAFMLERCRERDAAWDGRFLMGVTSTGIYCLPSCPARDPSPENVRFFGDPEDARRAGLRPCRRCRPDERWAGLDPELEAAEGLARDVRRDPARFAGTADLARAAGLGPTKLAALLRAHFHVTPAALLAGARLEAAARRLALTEERVLAVGESVGFASSSTFHERFRRRTGLAPKAFRALAREDAWELALPRDFRTGDVLDYLGRDSEGALEERRGSSVVKALVLEGRAALLELELAPGRARARLEWDGAAEPQHRLAAHRAVVRVLGLGHEPAAFERRVAGPLGLERLVRGRRGLRVPGSAAPFEALVWAVLGQQVNVAFALALRTRLARRVGRRFRGRLVHPTAEDLAALEPAELRADQVSGRKAEVLVALAREVAAGELDLDALAAGSAVRAERELVARRGVGPWTAHYVMLRGFALPDCVPVGDAGLRAGLQRLFELPERPGPDETRALMAPFAPHRSLAVAHLWRLAQETPKSRETRATP